MSVTYNDLTSTLFPEGVDTLELYQELTTAQKAIVVDWNALIAQKRFTEADALMAANPDLAKSFPTAEKWNKTMESIIAVQRFFKDSVFTYIQDTGVDVKEFILSAVKYKGNFSPSVLYGLYNLVYYETTDEETGKTIDAYMSYKETIPIGTLPTNTSYWFPVTLRGNMGASGVGLSFRKNWDYTKQYYENDIVLHDGDLWYAKQDNINSAPILGSANWEVFYELKQTTVSIIMIDGKPLSEGLACAAFSNPMLFKGIFVTEATITGGYFYELRFNETNKLIADSTETKSGEDYITTIKLYKTDGTTIDKTITKTETKVSGVYKTIIA